MVDIIKELIESLINESISLFDGFLTNQLQTIMYAEREWGTLGGLQISFDAPANIIYNYALVLITIKILLKMFSIYVGWTDGELNNPLQMIVYYLRALIIAVCFKDLYDFMARLTKSMLDDLLQAIVVNEITLEVALNGFNLSQQGLFYVISILVFIILCFILKFQFIQRGLEMYVVRIGFPLACVGLIDSNSGSFAPYLKIFIQNMMTTIVQIVMFKISFVILSGGHIFWGIASISMTLNTPKFLGQYMVQVFNTNGFGLYSKATGAVSSVANMVKSSVSKAGA